jgi:putative transposase
VLSVVDEYTREVHALHAARSIGAGKVQEVMREFIEAHGAPGYIRSDNGPESIAKAVREWITEQGFQTLYIEPGSPRQNAYSESFNSRLRFRDGLQVNRKKVHRIMKLKGWTLPKRRTGRRPRVEASRSVAECPNQRWATDLALVHCGRDGWCVFVPVIDCCTREVLGHAVERTGRAKTAERALEEALLARFGTLRSAPPGMRLRHDNGLVFGSRQYRAVVSDYGLQQEYITPYTPQQNGLCERFIKTFKEELCWTQRFASLEHARMKVRA